MHKSYYLPCDVPLERKFREVLKFSQLPNDWQIVCAETDWSGSPLLVAVEGKPPFPQGRSLVEYDWYGIPAKAHHVIYWEGSTRKSVTLEESNGVISLHGIQPLGAGWLLHDFRSGQFRVYERSGQAQRTLDFGDGICDVQTAQNGHIWVSYIDEGVFGDGIGRQGVVAFDASSAPIFKFHEFIEQADVHIPGIDDCYAMNVAGEDEVWLCYYSDFPLVSLKGFQLQHIWNDFGCMGRAFAIFEDHVIFPKCYTRSEGRSRLMRRSLSGPPHTEQEVTPVDESGAVIGGVFRTTARGANLYLWNDSALLKLV